jgi:ribosomal protein S18 acetylase RimI-like enzyme
LSKIDIAFRPAQPDELNSIHRMFSATLRVLPYYSSVAKKDELAKYTVSKLKSNLKADQNSILLAKEASGDIVGFCFSHFDDYTIWLDWIVVERRSRKKGVGKELLEVLFRTAIKRKAHKIWCDCRTSNFPSRALLSSYGFEKIAVIKNHWYCQDFILWQKFV